MDWNIQSVKYLHELVQQYDERKSRGWEAEFLERIGKEWACLHCGGNSWVSDFSASLVFKGCLPDLENSKLVKASTVPKVMSRNPRHSTGAYWHRYCCCCCCCSCLMLLQQQHCDATQNTCAATSKQLAVVVQNCTVIKTKQNCECRQNDARILQSFHFWLLLSLQPTTALCQHSGNRSIATHKFC